jgi:hypothetical protein
MMLCARCGAALDHAGQAHTCGPAGIPVADPLVGWTVAAWFLMGLSALFAGASVVYAVVKLNMVRTATVTAADEVGALVFLVAIVGLAVASIVWRSSTRKLVDAHGGDGRRYARHWGNQVYGVATVLVIFVQFEVGVDSHDGIVAIAVLRCVAALALIGGVLHTRARIRRLMAGTAREHADPADRLVQGATHVDWNAVPWDPDLEDVIDRERHRNSSS